jgi:hypothetical protein
MPPLRVTQLEYQMLVVVRKAVGLLVVALALGLALYCRCISVYHTQLMRLARSFEASETCSVAAALEVGLVFVVDNMMPVSDMGLA